MKGCAERSVKRWSGPIGCGALLAAGLCSLAGMASAQQGLVADVTPVTEATPHALEVSVKSLPKLDADSANHPNTEISWLPTRGQNGVGPMLSLSPGSAPISAAPGFGATGAAPSASLGVHWRYTLDSNYRVDVTAWKRITPEPDAYALTQMQRPRYGARVEMPLSPAQQSGLVADRGFVGMQLDSGARISVKRSGGRPMLYYRNKF